MLGIVIVSYRSDEETVRFVREELSKISLPHRIVVVDNGADESAAASLSARLDGLAVLPSENGGYAKGNNKGALWLRENVAELDSILFTNNDILLKGDSVVETLVKTLRADARIGCIGPEIIGLDGRRQSPFREQGMWERYVWMYWLTPFLRKDRKRELFGLDYSENALRGPHFRLMGSFLLVDAGAFFSAGMFDEDTFLYGEECILSARLAAIGKICWFEPSVTVIHAHGATVGRHFDRYHSAMMEFDGMSVFYRKYRKNSRLSVRLARSLYSVAMRLR